MSRVTVYSTAHCSFCDRTKTMLDKWGIEFDEARIDQDEAALRDYARDTNNARSVPQIMIDGNLIGGFTELTELHMDGDLDDLMPSD